MNTTIVRPDFTALNGQSLVDAYNGYVNKWRNSKFSSKADGVAACNRAFDEFVKKNNLQVVESDIPDEFEQSQEDYARAKQVEAEVIADLEAKASSKKVVNKSAAPRKSKNSTRIIKIKALRNPRREGSKAWQHFEVMNRSDVKTVSDYLNHFPAEQRKNANQWLSNTIADGFVELVDAE